MVIAGTNNCPCQAFPAEKSAQSCNPEVNAWARHQSFVQDNVAFTSTAATKSREVVN